MNCALDLHIHSCASPCADEDMTPSNIAGMAHLKGLDLIAVTDHNTCANLPALEKTCAAYGVGLLPGMEAETREEVHVLCYFPTVAAALAFDAAVSPLLPPVPNPKGFFGRQLVRDEDDEILSEIETLLVQSLDLSLDELIALVDDYGGVCIPSHINRGSNSLLVNLGFIPPGTPFAGLEVDRNAGAVLADTAPYKIFYSSDAHSLGDISERTFLLDVREPTAEAMMECLHALRARAMGA